MLFRTHLFHSEKENKSVAWYVVVNTSLCLNWGLFQKIGYMLLNSLRFNLTIISYVPKHIASLYLKELMSSAGNNKELGDYRKEKSEGNITGHFPSRRDNCLLLPGWIRVSLVKRVLSRAGSPGKGLEIQGRLVCLGNWRGFNLRDEHPGG